MSAEDTPKGVPLPPSLSYKPPTYAQFVGDDETTGMVEIRRVDNNQVIVTMTIKAFKYFRGVGSK